MKYENFRLYPLSVFLPAVLIILSACSAPLPVETSGLDASQPTSQGEESEAAESSALELEDEFSIEEGTDLEGVDVCSLLPIQEVGALVGPLREEETETTLSLDREVGCMYHDQEGHFYEVTYYPLDHWGIAEFTLNNVQAVDGVLDGAYLGTYSGGEITLKALVNGELVIGVRVCTGEQATAAALADLAAANRP